MSFNDIENVSLKIPAVLKQNLKSVFLQQTFFCSVRARLLTKKYKKKIKNKSLNICQDTERLFAVMG